MTDAPQPQAEIRETELRERGQRLRERILKAREEAHSARRSNRLGMSWAFGPCPRATFARFRWLDDPKPIDGRTLRIFDRGDLEESRLVEDLRRVGAAVMDRDPDDARRQIPAEQLDGWLAGFLDGVATGVPEAPLGDEWCVLEFKTSKADKWRKLDREGLRKAQRAHFDQMQSYMLANNIRQGLYLCVNKDTEELYPEFVLLDEKHADRLVEKARGVLEADTTPDEIHPDPDFYICKMCSASAWCRKTKFAPRHCRSCAFGSPVAGSDGVLWKCGRHNETRGVIGQAEGCEDHRFHPAVLVDAYQTDAAPGLEWVRYQMPNGEFADDVGGEGLRPAHDETSAAA